MRLINEQDYKLFEKLVSLSQDGIKKVMTQYLISKYGANKIISTKDYVVAIGEIPIALVAHMDTVFKEPVSDLYYDQRKGVLWSPQGLGADDRAGIFAILKIIQDGFRPAIILTTDEEKGGLGASALGEISCPIPDLKYMIQLDRRGTNDCVFYDCCTEEFIKYISSFGFCEAYGSFSDISFLMPTWEICGVNLSIGYTNEHSVSETLHIVPLYDTIRKVKVMLKAENIPDFKYDEINYMDYMSHWFKKLGVKGVHCSKCKELFSEYEVFPVKSKDGLIKFYCPDCIVGNVDWCSECGEAFEVNSKQHSKLCNDCVGKVCTTEQK